MARIVNPVTFATSFRISPDRLERFGVLNPTINVDTKLFIDPVLLEHSATPDISKGASRRLRTHFSNIISLLKASQREGDVAWRGALRLVRFPELRANCLGYGGASINGTAFSRELSLQLLRTAAEIVALGIDDPDLFVLLPLLDKDVGPDRISDLTTNIIAPDLAALTKRICDVLKVPTESLPLGGSTYQLPRNQTLPQPTPILLVPVDILRSLPVASGWREVADVAAANAAIRERVNRLIGNIWESKTRKDKAKLRARALASKKAFDSLLDLIHKAPVPAYDIHNDPEGLLVWRRLLETVALDFPLALSSPTTPTDDEAIDLVQRIVDQFTHLIEKQGLWRLLWNGAKVHKEKVAQMLFFAVAEAYCKANNLPLTPEAETGSGPVDFKFGSRYDQTILVEAKLSRNRHLLSGFDSQLAAYAASASAIDATYLVVDVGKLDKKYQALQQRRQNQLTTGTRASRLRLVDAKRQISASKRRH
jgi:hypothetical protein